MCYTRKRYMFAYIQRFVKISFSASTLSDDGDSVKFVSNPKFVTFKSDWLAGVHVRLICRSDSSSAVEWTCKKGCFRAWSTCTNINKSKKLSKKYVCVPNENFLRLKNILYLLFVDEFKVLSWSWSTVSWASVKSGFNSNIVGHIIKSTSFLCSQSKATATGFRMRRQQSENDCKLDSETDHVHDWLIEAVGMKSLAKIMIFKRLNPVYKPKILSQIWLIAKYYWR